MPSAPVTATSCAAARDRIDQWLSRSDDPGPAAQELLGRVGRLDYKTLRYPGHGRVFRAMRDLGLLSREPVMVDGRPVARLLADHPLASGLARHAAIPLA